MVRLLLSLWVISCSSAFAQDFVYQPVNPAFGGNYLNYSWLLNSAQVQNGFTEEDGLLDSPDQDPIQDFSEGLQRQLLSRLSSELINSQFGEEGLEEGEYQIGAYQIEVLPGVDGVEILILDTSTGGQTTVNIPYF
ncbi:MAG: curli production assembly/transport component CsgF [Bacteroidota bacterium]